MRLLRMALFVLSGIWLLTLPLPAAAQSQSPQYWTYTAADQLQLVLNNDINHDGVEEFLLATRNGKIDLIGTNGDFQWSYEAGAPVQALAAINVNGRDRPQKEVVIGIENQLILLNDTGEMVWQKAIEPLTPPAALFTHGGLAAVETWLAEYTAQPVSITPLDYNNDGQDEILLLLQSGQIQLFDAAGQRLWTYDSNNNPLLDTSPHLIVADLDKDGRQEITLGYFNPNRGFSRLVRLGADGGERWNKAVSGRITALTFGRFTGDGPDYVAVGTSLGNVIVYAPNGQSVWPRTVNRTVTALAFTQLLDQSVLAVGTRTGSVILFDEVGRRTWTSHLAPDADRPVITLSAAMAVVNESDPVLAAVLGPLSAGDAASTLLLGNDGRTLRTIVDAEPQGITRLVDVNADGHVELLLARFASLELVGLGSGVSETAEEWSLGLDAEPLAYQVVDFDQDGQDELLIGTDKGRLHRLSNDGSPEWIISPGGRITHLAVIANLASPQPQIVMGRTVDGGNGESAVRLELRQANGEKIWEQALPAPITRLLIANVNNRGNQEIVAGTSAGDVLVFTTSGAELQRHQIPGSVQHLHLLPGADERNPDRNELVVANAREIYKLQEGNPEAIRMATYGLSITHIHVLQQAGNELAVRLLVLVADGKAYGINWRGILLPPWPLDLGGVPLHSIPTDDLPNEIFDLPQTRPESFLIATTDGALVNVRIDDSTPTIVWRMLGLTDVLNLHLGDVDGDSLQDIMVGNQEPSVYIYTQEPAFATKLNLRSDAFGLTTMHRNADQSEDMTVIAANGQVQLFRAQENRPPLLSNPTTNVRQGQYSINISVTDVENDRVTVRLDMQDPNTLQWLPQDEQELSNGNGQLSFSVVSPPFTEAGVRYRFHFADAFHNGDITPTIGPVPLIPSPFLNASRAILGVLSVLGLTTAFILVRQAQLPSSRARRFHRRLRQQPAMTLLMLERRYTYTEGSPSFLLYLTTQARQSGDWVVASLADGIFLLADRPRAALSILNSALEEIQQRQLPWQGLDRWLLTFKTGQALLEAPSITELTLLRPQLVELLSLLDEQDAWSPPLEMLLPMLTNMRDSERVESVEDRLVYLNEAASLIKLSDEQLPDFSERIEKTLSSVITTRWAGMVGARIEELRGRAELVITLKTKRLVPNGRTDVALEILNKGRAAAEYVLATLDEMPAYQVHSPPQVIPLIPPGRTRQIGFVIEPQVADRFRIALTLTYSDRNEQQKMTAFGDMVHLLTPVRDFTPIANPYIPGSPLRRDSTLFFGRQEIFDFIGENIGRHAQRNVLILIGQRRTGKTSTLLQLEHHLPDHLYPVYIDCQSLGVTPGLPALFNELAWQIADSLLSRNIEVAVPADEAWETDSPAYFQRQFLPYVRSLIPDTATLLLVFDEFESFESLVDDHIVPATLFPFLRHLMQHSEGLGFIFVGTHRLEEMGADYWSVLFNIALYHKIGYLHREAATRLITEPVAPTLVYDDLALDKILRVTASHPYFLQLVCYTLVKQANKRGGGYVTISDVNDALDEMLRLGEVHFAYMWRRSSWTERAMLTAVAHLLDTDLPFHPEQIMDVLTPYGIRLHPTQVTAALNSLVERDIMHEVTEAGQSLYELHIGLVGLWVAKNKSLSKLLDSTKGAAVAQSEQMTSPLWQRRPNTA